MDRLLVVIGNRGVVTKIAAAWLMQTRVLEGGCSYEDEKIYAD